MMRKLLLLAPVALAACALEISGPRTDLRGLPEGLEVEFTVTPNIVEQHAPFTAQLDITNTSAETVQIVTAHGCLVLPHVVRDGERVPFEGTAWGCTAAITTHSFAPGETRSHTWPMRAELYAQHAGDVDGAPAPKGTYRVQAVFETYREDSPDERPTVEALLQVR